MAKDKFIIEPHFRLHEWVAEEKGYFRAEGLDYDFREAFCKPFLPSGKVPAPMPATRPG